MRLAFVKSTLQNYNPRRPHFDKIHGMFPNEAEPKTTSFGGEERVAATPVEKIQIKICEVYSVSKLGDPRRFADALKYAATVASLSAEKPEAVIRVLAETLVAQCDAPSQIE